MKQPILTILASCLAALSSVAAVSPPNIVYILADDMGYGDVQCLNPERGMIATPHMDRVAAEGMIFTDAHTTSSVCTPTRYGIITGRYNWRTWKQEHVLDGYDLPLIPTTRMTVPSFLSDNGYTTAMIGKWHLGLEIATIDGKKARPAGGLGAKRGKGAFPPAELSNIDWKGTIQGGPVDLGFDSWFGITASLDFPPYVWIRNRNWVGEGTHAKAFRRPGPATEDFEAIDVLDKLAAEAVEYITDYQGNEPFFIYMPLPSPHTPIVPSKKWQGKSGLGQYGDFMMQTDDVVGQVVNALQAKGITDNTILIVTSDNGCSKAAGISNLEKQGHFPSAQYRGSKADLWEGGHRVPFLVKWPAVIQAGSVSDELTCQTDLLATCAELVGKSLPENAGEDSESILPLFSGEPVSFTRKGIINHSVSGHFAYRQGKWKLLLAKGSAGWTAPTEKALANVADAPEGQLYDLEADPGEQNNLYLKNPEVVETLMAQLKEDVANGRSTEGPKQANDIPVNQIKLWKGNIAR
ncbi:MULTISPECIES: arylsulfatase [unclassified Lentimonas]|uniref:sulfatase family protein n=1 Tax=unclassified Lentimonas TaxID=2630993 RepID=UPI001322C99F|nr:MULTISPECIES: arylsulfatase [unclassified Lentimonas]CAA6677763.1 Choline-sulfatase (EC [Lentimonas sp. CC4]CAA6685027.1 Choline-sulfatase (EC [Lentimonas sp. CC6]CAA7077855.1 Choline-sulfatase (EC [Lentimonas sp. CC4]CAA7169783.1 Choline-sulfatase (EC [Lentimonas sp. CC21]CAA7179901.1 Choline-sulfatase (EC [Lentimonas sp. CC8]